MARSADIAATPTARAMDRAIEQAIEGSSSHPERTAFVQADSPQVGREIVRALDDGDERIIVAKTA
jgi:hypothetical protein